MNDYCFTYFLPFIFEDKLINTINIINNNKYSDDDLLFIKTMKMKNNDVKECFKNININDIQLINYDSLCCRNLEYINSKLYKDLKKKGYNIVNKVSCIFCDNNLKHHKITKKHIYFIGTRKFYFNISKNSYFNNELVQTVFISKSFKSFDNFCFKNMCCLKKVYFDSNIKIEYIGMDLFQYCHHLISVNLPNDLKILPFGSFENCNCLESINLKNIEFLSSNSFVSCKSLSKLIIPNKTETINSYFCVYCSELKDVYIGKNIKNIDFNITFFGCHSIKNVYYYKETIITNINNNNINLILLN